MKTLKKLEKNRLSGNKLMNYFGGTGEETNGTSTSTTCNNLTGVTTQTTYVTTDNPDGSSCVETTTISD